MSDGQALLPYTEAFSLQAQSHPDLIDLHKELQFGPDATEISPFSLCIAHLAEGLLLPDLLLFLESILS